ncbi:hypothetical protein [Conexibacter sp. CPCC 206217]|uniref:hypothetical protein n=1 Tax=Conexibacter sp. CPCC 206217 TaxID=3064574 RepID=UPI002721F8AF|nr:hypothetical protein [Conexibacter sp. CPCC 206217]MDO8213484.1 hypothetical protein [Conexibacter sp. CPCC 206217]
MHRLKSLKRLPSPAMIVSLVALFAALGGTSYAALSANSVNSRTIQNGTIRNEDFKDGTLRGAEFKRDSLGGGAIKEEALDATKIANVRTATRATTADSAAAADRATVAAGLTRQLAVAADGTRSLDRGGVVSVTKTAPGSYQVIFDADVRACIPTATLQITPAPADRPATPVTGEIAVAPLAGNVNGVQVATADSAGLSADRAFNLTVSC